MENIQKQLNEIKELLLAQNLQQKQIFTVEDSATYLQLSKSCLYKLTCNKEIPFYSPGGKKIYFRKSELDEWVLKSRVSTDNDVVSNVDNYLSKNYRS